MTDDNIHAEALGGVGPLPDGTYDVFIIDTEYVPGRGNPATGALQLDLTVIGGEFKGEVLTLSSAELAGEAIDLIGTPATMTITGGQPHLTFD